MLVENIVTAICLALLIGEAAYVAVGFALKKDRAGRITFVRNFKKGKCLAVYLTAIPLLAVGIMYTSGKTLPAAVVNALAKTIDMIVLKFDVSVVQGLMTANLFYAVTIWICFALVVINAALFTLSLLSQLMWQSVQTTRALRSKGHKLFVFGCNENNISVYNSSRLKNKFIVDKAIDDKKRADLYMRKISFVCKDHAFAADRIFAKLDDKKNNYDVVINTGDDCVNLDICRLFIDRIAARGNWSKKYTFDKLRVFVFGDPRYEAVYEDVMRRACGCIHYVNKYRMIAMNFIERYPLAYFLDGRHIDYRTSLVREDTDINVCMIGFGNTNRQIFLTSVANNQFIEKDKDGKIKIKKVNYRIFDRNPAENNKSLNHNYYRYRDELENLDPKDYLPLPDLPAKEEFKTLDVNDKRFYTNVREGFSFRPHAANFVIIAFGTDLENIDMAQKLIEKKREWKLKNLTVFVKVRQDHGEREYLERAGCRFIANERDSVYNMDEIAGDDIFKMAKRRNEIYNLEYKVAGNNDVVEDEKLLKKNRAEADKKWYLDMSQAERESNLYCCLGLKSKLNLMGLDYVKKTEDGKALSENEYLKIYIGENTDDKIEYYDQKADGKKIVKYSLDFPPSRRRNLTEHEHLRWNSFMISKGTIPSSIDEILTEQKYVKGKPVYDEKTKKPVLSNGKNYRMRRHGNLTTFDGLVAFRKLVAERDGCDEAKKDVIKYDCQLLDDARWLLDECGFKIVKLHRIARCKGKYNSAFDCKVKLH